MPDYRAADGVRLHYTDEGEGLPLVCLPGLTREGTDFDFVAMHLTGVRLIRPDYRGRGRSDRADPATYTVPHEAQDVLALLDHLRLEKVALLGTSRGGLISMALAATAKDRLAGVALNDIGPVIEETGLDFIRTYLGRNPVSKTRDEAAKARAKAMTGFSGVPEARWREEVARHYDAAEGGLVIRYDPKLRDAVLASGAAPAADLWPLFDALAGLPLCLIRGETSDILSRATADEMRRRRPDMIFAEVPGRGHIPFLDEAESLAALHDWLGLMGVPQ
ncbi:alpha/beta fold hydrolase [Wenxinia marina]|uniref:Putative hydrolase or acyltransferase (Alpha/beta hydrolase superfamily) n=1 Tax=Wenxinia marina DSM 24838 TaxID=1123501 RepID=A0A0D0Q8G9_9RHOB|nr:alpha/beta hydrolase [Wenxinia marina]KIQ70679.1 putative hydrolase or acyltransferase (alpha/beta hydrolase superfamily) [Wenxinia marina DSM 24838]GGL51365.1 hydrolase [Wenxinia marina]